MNAILIAIGVVVLLPGASTALHLGVLGLASLLYRDPKPSGETPSVSFIVLVPAHNEELVIQATLDALVSDMRARDQLLVVADRCTDATAAIARAAGALVLERSEHEEPGRAAARQAGIDYSLELPWDAMVMVDADSIVEPGFFDACEQALAGGAQALQARSEAEVGSRVLDGVNVAAFALQGVLMPRGRDRLGLLVRLRGTGMVLRRSIVTRFNFRALASEDLWYSLDLALADIIPRHVERARLRSLNVSTWHDAGVQRVRYEAGRMSAAREFVGGLLRRHSAATLEAAWFLVTPPFAVAGFLLVLAVAFGLLSGSALLFWVAVGFLAMLAGAVGLGLLEARGGDPYVAVARDRPLLSSLEGAGAAPSVVQHLPQDLELWRDTTWLTGSSYSRSTFAPCRRPRVSRT